MLFTSEQVTVALLGGQKTGKSTLFNALTGKKQTFKDCVNDVIPSKVENFRNPYGDKIELHEISIDYSPENNSVYESINYSISNGCGLTKVFPDIYLCILSATNLREDLLLAMEVIELGRPVVVAITMLDIAESRGVSVDTGKLSKHLGVPVLAIQADKMVGILELKQALRYKYSILEKPEWLHGDSKKSTFTERISYIQRIYPKFSDSKNGSEYNFYDKLDSLLVSPLSGFLALILIIFIIFFITFSMTSHTVPFIESSFFKINQLVGINMPQGIFNDLICDGVLPGLAGIMLLLPNIIILSLCIKSLEVFGYLARAHLLMNRLMHPIGLFGKNFLPVVEENNHSIPCNRGKSIRSYKDRIMCVLVTPWILSSYRLSIYTLFVSIFLSKINVFQQACFMLIFYSTGIIVSVFGAMIMQVQHGNTVPKITFRHQLPSYRLPNLKLISRTICAHIFTFVKKSIPIILALSVILWVLTKYPKITSDNFTANDKYQVTGVTFVDQLGATIEPVFRPLGYDWPTSIAVLTSMVTPNFFYSSLKISTNQKSVSQDKRLSDIIIDARWRSGNKIYTPMTILSLLVFLTFSINCFSSSIIVWHKTRSYKHGFIEFLSIILFAYTAALAVFQIGTLFA